MFMYALPYLLVTRAKERLFFSFSRELSPAAFLDRADIQTFSPSLSLALFFLPKLRSFVISICLSYLPFLPVASLALELLRYVSPTLAAAS